MTLSMKYMYNSRDITRPRRKLVLPGKNTCAHAALPVFSVSNGTVWYKGYANYIQAVVCGHCLWTLSETINETLKCLPFVVRPDITLCG